jgi:hypothetical protein
VSSPYEREEFPLFGKEGLGEIFRQERFSSYSVTLKNRTIHLKGPCSISVCRDSFLKAIFIGLLRLG